MIIVLTILTFASFVGTALTYIPLGKNAYFSFGPFVGHLYDHGGWYGWLTQRPVGHSIHCESSWGSLRCEAEYRLDFPEPFPEHWIGGYRLGLQWGVHGNMTCSYSATDTEEDRKRAFMPSRFVRFHAPAWLPPLVFGAYPTWCLIGAIRKRRRLGRNQCVYCRYDLTGNQSGACPECGKRVAAPRR
jgi:hypothetical protein